MANVKIPDVLERLSGGRRIIEVKGATLIEALDNLEEKLPGIKERLIEDGEIRHFINVYVDGEDVRFTDGLNTIIDEKSEITILPAVAGG